MSSTTAQIIVIALATDRFYNYPCNPFALSFTGSCVPEYVQVLCAPNSSTSINANMAGIGACKGKHKSQSKLFVLYLHYG